MFNIKHGTNFNSTDAVGTITSRMVLSSIPFVGLSPSRPRSKPFYDDNSLSCSLSKWVDSDSPDPAKPCFCCGRRRFLESASMATTLFPIVPSTAAIPRSKYTDVLNKFHPPKPGWYEELYASVLNNVAKSYEAELEIFSNLRENAQKILEIGIGTGPNLSYYASNSDVLVVGIDPNQKMEKYARSSAISAGLPPSNFEFIHAVGEVIPLDDASVDAVVGTLVLCTVKDVSMTLNEESAEARWDVCICGTCWSKRRNNSEIYPENSRSSSTDTSRWVSRVELYTASLKKASFVNPHIYGVAYK